MITNQNPFGILSQLWTNLWAQTWWVFLGEYLAEPAAENAIFWVMTDAQVFGHGMLHYNSVQFKPVPDCFWQCHSEVGLYFYIYYIRLWMMMIHIKYEFVLFICRFLALPQLTSCSTHVSERKTHKNPQSGREVCWVCMRRMRCTFSSEALNDEYRKWHPMKIMVTDPQVRSFEGRWPLSTSRRVQKKWGKAWRAIQRWSFLRIKLGNFQK